MMTFFFPITRLHNARHQCGQRVFLFLVFLCFIGTPGICRAEVVGEYSVKAAFLYHFANFVNWPPSTFQATDGHIRFCIIGKDPFGQTLEDTLANKTVRDHSFEIRRNPPTDQLQHCHLLYIPASASSHLQTVHRGMGKEDVFTVGETQDFMRQGGMVQFFVENQKIRFTINTDVINQTNLKVSSKLLRLAKIYIP